MPRYLYICKGCGSEAETTVAIAPGKCVKCGGEFRRNWKGEGAISTFHCTRDLYAQSKKVRDD